MNDDQSTDGRWPTCGSWNPTDYQKLKEKLEQRWLKNKSQPGEEVRMHLVGQAVLSHNHETKLTTAKGRLTKVQQKCGEAQKECKLTQKALQAVSQVTGRQSNNANMPDPPPYLQEEREEEEEVFVALQRRRPPAEVPPQQAQGPAADVSVTPSAPEDLGAAGIQTRSKVKTEADEEATRATLEKIAADPETPSAALMAENMLKEGRFPSSGVQQTVQLYTTEKREAIRVVVSPTKSSGGTVTLAPMRAFPMPRPEGGHDMVLVHRAWSPSELKQVCMDLGNPEKDLENTLQQLDIVLACYQPNTDDLFQMLKAKWPAQADQIQCVTCSEITATQIGEKTSEMVCDHGTN